MSTVRRTTAVAAATVLLPTTLLAVSPAAQGSSGAPPPQPAVVGAPALGPVRTIGARGLRPDLAVDVAGNVTVVWATDWWRGPVRAVHRPAGGSWSDPVTIGRGTLPQVAVDDAGVVTAVWESNRRNRTTGVATARRGLDGEWSAARRLTTTRTVRHYWRPETERVGADDVDLAVGPGGAVAVGWTWGSDERELPFRIQAAYRPAGVAWEDTVSLTPRDGSVAPSVAVDESGDALVAYGKPEQLLAARTYKVGEGWAAAVELATTDDNGGPDLWQAVAQDDSGATVVYKRDTDSYGTAYAVTRPPGESWQDPEPLSAENAGAWAITACADRAGTLTATWSGIKGRLDTVRRPLGQPWTTPTMLQPRRSWVDAPTTMVDEAGDVAVAWSRYDVGLMAAHRPVDGDWSPAFRITPEPAAAHYTWSTALFPDGAVAAVWQRGFDPGPIRFRRVTP